MSREAHVRFCERVRGKFLCPTHLKMRYYDPKTGRFLQPDPIGYGDGLNLYRFASNDPINFTDPMGLAADGSQLVSDTGGAIGNGFGGWLDDEGDGRGVGSPHKIAWEKQIPNFKLYALMIMGIYQATVRNVPHIGAPDSELLQWQDWAKGRVFALPTGTTTQDKLDRHNQIVSLVKFFLKGIGITAYDGNKFPLHKPVFSGFLDIGLDWRAFPDLIYRDKQGRIHLVEVKTSIRKLPGTEAFSVDQEFLYPEAYKGGVQMAVSQNQWQMLGFTGERVSYITLPAGTITHLFTVEFAIPGY